MRKKYWLFILVLLLLSCTTGNQAGKGGNARVVSGQTNTAEAPVLAGTDKFALELFPKTAARDSTVNCILTGFDARDSRIEWMLNGAPVESNSPVQFRLSNAKRGDTLQARAFVHGREILSNTVGVVNSPPEITNVRLLPEVLQSGNSLRAVAEGRDPDGDTISYVYEWTVNGNAAGNKEYLEVPIKRGDKIELRVTPSDTEGCGRAYAQNTEIQNSPPIIDKHADFTFDGTTHLYQVKAFDPDGDTLVYSLKGAPAGMAIDQATGQVRWAVPADFKGTVEVTAVVDDGNAASASCVQKITIK